MIKLKNILAEKMLRFNTKNITEQQLDMFKKSDDEYWLDRPNFKTGQHSDMSLEDYTNDAENALRLKDGKGMIRVATAFLHYVNTGIYEEYKDELGSLDLYYDDKPKFGTVQDHVQAYIDSIQEVNQDVIKNAIRILKTDPRNELAMTTIYDTIRDIYSANDSGY
jgi:hypothetical protein